MSTRAVIARYTGPGKFSGRYQHSDGYPKGLGHTLYALYHGHFKQDLDKMLSFLVDQHPAGWSCIGDCDFSLPAIGFDKYMKGYKGSGDWFGRKPNGETDYSVRHPHGPVCFCHSKRDGDSEPWEITQDDAPCDREWLYVLNAGPRTMEVSMRLAGKTKDEDGDYVRTWQPVATVNFDAAEPDWTEIECGKNLERCRHVAEHHFPELEGTSMGRLGSAKFLGKQKLETRDACGYEVDGIRYSTTGSGASASDRNGKQVWTETVRPLDGAKPYYASGKLRLLTNFLAYFAGGIFQVHGDGSFPMIVRYQDGNNSRTYPGVTALYPPTLANPVAVFAELRKHAAASNPSTDALSSTLDPTPAQTQAGDTLLNWAYGRRFRTGDLADSMTQ